PEGLDGPPLPWWDHVAYVLKRTDRPSFTLERPEPLVVDIARDGRHAAMMSVIRAYLRAVRAEDASLLDHLDDRAGVDVASEAPGRPLFLTWDQARRMGQAGMSIGSHTCTHPRLSRLSEAEQRTELVASKARLGHELGRPVETIAYPFGVADAFNEATKRLAH